MRRLPVFLSIIGLISLIGLIGIKGKGLVWAASSSKLGIFLLASYKDGSNGGEKIINACPKVVTFYDPQNSPERLQLLRDYKTKCPGGISVVRVHDGISGKQVDFAKDPAKTADEFSTLILGEVNRIGNPTLVNYVSGTNEFENYDDEELVFQEKTEKWQWLGMFWTRLAQNISQAGFKPNIGDINVGHPNVNTSEVLNVLIPTLREVKKLGGAWSYHGYTIDYLMDAGGKTVLENPLHYREFYDHFRKYAPDLLDLPLLITETGVAEGGDRLQGFMPDNIEKFKQWLEWYDGQLQQDGYVIGATIFQSGDIGQWASFNTDYIAEWLCTKLGGTDCKVSVAEYKGSTTTAESCKPSFADQLTDYMREISTSMQKNFITEQLLRINQGNLPPLNLKSKTGAENEDCQNEDTKTFGTVAEGAKLYTVAKAIKTPESHNLEENLWETAKKKMETLLGIGGDSAKKWSETGLPPGVADEIYNRDEKTAGLSNLAYKIEGEQVLGISDFFAKIMNQSLFVKYCEGLPPQLCKDNKLIGYKPVESLTPVPSGGPSVSIAPPPAGGGGYGSVGKCELGYGYCSVEYLKPFFDNDQIKAEKASQICWAESTGKRDALNRGCFKENVACRYRETSVGLFQINLWFDKRCPGTLQNTVWGNKAGCSSGANIADCNCNDLIWNPPISCEEGPNYESCLADFSNPETNINFAKNLSGGGVDWSPTWSTALPENCDIE